MKKFSIFISGFSIIATTFFFLIGKDVAGVTFFLNTILFFVFAFGEELPIQSFKVKELEVVLKQAKVSLQQIQDLAYSSAESVFLLQKKPAVWASEADDDFCEKVLPVKTEEINNKIYENLSQLNISPEKIEKLKQEYGE